MNVEGTQRHICAETVPAVLAAALGLFLIVSAAALLWHAPRCTGWQPSDRCAIAGGAKVFGVNTSARTNHMVKQ